MIAFYGCYRNLIMASKMLNSLALRGGESNEGVCIGRGGYW